jgi:hypothetical protein
MPGSTPDVAPAGHPYRVEIEAERQGSYEVVSLVRSLTPDECLVPGYYRHPETQEGFIGRRKADSAELDPLPPASHVARTDQELLGKIFRRNIAYGTLTRHGTLFVGFSRDQGTLRAMLVSMLGVEGGA